MSSSCCAWSLTATYGTICYGGNEFDKSRRQDATTNGEDAMNASSPARHPAGSRAQPRRDGEIPRRHAQALPGQGTALQLRAGEPRFTLSSHEREVNCSIRLPQNAV